MPSCPPGTVQVGIISVKGPDGEEGCVICEDCYQPNDPNCGKCYDVATAVTIEITANRFQSNKFSCGQIACTIQCDDRGEQRLCSTISQQRVINVAAGRCLFNTNMSRGRFYTEFATDICGPGVVMWPDLMLYAQWWACPQGTTPDTPQCPVSLETFSTTGCEGGFTYTWKIISEVPI